MHCRRTRPVLSLPVIVAAICWLPGPLPAQENKPAPQKHSPGKPAPAAKEQAADAVDAARDYTQKLKSAKPVEAVRAYWDMDGMMSSIFGEHLRRHSEQEREEMQTTLLGFIEKIYTDPNIVKAMRQASLEDFESADGKEPGTVVVSFNARFPDKVVPNALHMKQVDGKWRIIDAGANGRMMVPTIRAEYLPQAQRVTPLQYMKMLASTI